MSQYKTAAELKRGDFIMVYRAFYRMSPSNAQLPLRDPAVLSILQIVNIRDQYHISVLPGWLKAVKGDFLFEIGDSTNDDYLLQPRVSAQLRVDGIWLE